jgi:signal transduction histidine kinase
MFARLSLRPEDAQAAIRTEAQMSAKGMVSRLVFALVMSGTSLLWLPPAFPIAYLVLLASWEMFGRPRVAKRIAGLARPKSWNRAIYRAIVFVGAWFYSALPLTGILYHEMIGWYAALIAFAWTTIVAVTYFASDRWLFLACALPSFVVATVAPLLFGVPLENGVAIFLLHALFVLGAVQSAAHRAELVESVTKQEAARSKAESANIEKSAFIANVSHELRAPLNAIIGYTELLRESAQEEARAEEEADLDKVLTASRKLLSLVNEFLDISKIEAGRLTLNIDWYDASDMLTEAIGSSRAEIEANGSRLIVDVPTLGQGVSDEFRLGQCVHHMLANAARVTRLGEVTLRARCENAGGADWLVVEVADGNSNATPAELERLLDPFAQTQAGAEEQGAGLGLAITRRIARLLGGDLTVAVRAGECSVFTLRTPLVASTGTSSTQRRGPEGCSRVA